MSVVGRMLLLDLKKKRSADYSGQGEPPIHPQILHSGFSSARIQQVKKSSRIYERLGDTFQQGGCWKDIARMLRLEGQLENEESNRLISSQAGPRIPCLSISSKSWRNISLQERESGLPFRDCKYPLSNGTINYLWFIAISHCSV